MPGDRSDDHDRTALTVASAPRVRERLPELLLAAAVVVLGVVVTWEARGIRVPPMAARVGPRVIPYLVGGGLVVVGVWLAAEVLAGRGATPAAESEDADAALPTDWRTVAMLAGALLVYLLLIERAGFVVASTLLFGGAAFGMGSRRVARDLALGAALSLAVYVAFTRGLDLRLPAGWLGGVL